MQRDLLGPAVVTLIQVLTARRARPAATGAAPGFVLATAAAMIHLLPATRQRQSMGSTESLQ